MTDVETIPAGTVPEDYRQKGHFLLMGETESGKSYYAKWLVHVLSKGFPATADGSPPVYVYSGAHGAYQWTQPEDSGVQVAPPAHVYTEWDPAQLKAISEAIGGCGAGIIVFDDFLGTINFHHNTDFEGLFKYIRHKGGKIIVITHAPSDVPPAVRGNVSNIIIAYSDSVSLIRDLAQNYLGNDAHRLKQAMQSIREEFTMVKIRKGRIAGGGTIALHRAGPLGDPVDIPLGGHHASVGGATVGGVAAQARGDVSVGGHYNDHSTNQQFLRLEQDIRIQQQSQVMAIENLHARSAARMQIERAQLSHEQEMRQLRERGDVRRLAYNTFLSAEERDTVARVVGEGLGERRVTPYNVFSGGYLKVWMDTFFPADAYVDRDRGMATLATFGGNLADVAAGNKIGLLTEGLKFAATSGLGARLLGGRRDPGPSREELSEKKRRRLRPLVRDSIMAGAYKTADGRDDLIKTLNALSKNRGIHAGNVGAKALAFLKDCYPADHRRLTKDWGPTANPTATPTDTSIVPFTG